ncbi:MAG: hypothetical protein ACR2RD_03020 [Woeseiaceae bacterium]
MNTFDLCAVHMERLALNNAQFVGFASQEPEERLWSRKSELKLGIQHMKAIHKGLIIAIEQASVGNKRESE